VIYRALPGGSDRIVLYYCLMATWTGLGDNTELFWAVLSQQPGCWGRRQWDAWWGRRWLKEPLHPCESDGHEGSRENDVAPAGDRCRAKTCIHLLHETDEGAGAVGLFLELQTLYIKQPKYRKAPGRGRNNNKVQRPDKHYCNSDFDEDDHAGEGPQGRRWRLHPGGGTAHSDG
jgi:hypothetical protein